MAGPRALRACYCPQCAKYPNGLRSLTQVAWAKHNPIPGQPFRYNYRGPEQEDEVPVPRQPLSRSASVNLPSTPESPNASDAPDWPAELPIDENEEIVDEYAGDIQSDVEDMDGSDMGGMNDIGDYGDGFSDSGDEQPWDAGQPHDPIDNQMDPFDEGYSDEYEDDRQPELEEDEDNGPRHHDLDPVLRHMYTIVAMSKAAGSSRETTDLLLEQMTTALEMERGEEIEDKTFQTRTALRRLGVLPDDFMTRYLVCPNVACWHLTPYSQLSTLTTSACPATINGDPCDTPLFHTVNHVRTPYKVIPYCKLSTQLRALLRDPAIASKINEWRHRGNDLIDFGEESREIRLRFAPTMPSHVSKDGLMDGTAWRATVGGDVVRTVMEDGAVVDVENEDTYRHTGNPFGLQLVINCDWFAVKGLKDSSVGVIYAAIANLPRDMCFRSRYTCLLTVIPGPREPAEDCLSKVLAPIIADMKYCEGGFNMMLNEYPFPSPPRLHRVATRVLLNTSDLPATRKLSGFVGLANKTHPCHHCKIKRDDVNSPRGYDWRRLPLRDPEQMLAAAFRYRDTDDPGERAQIEEQYGVRFSPFLELVGYQHSASNPVDPLHNSFLGMAKSLVNMVLGIDRLFDGELAGEDRMERFTAVFERASVPGHLGRIAQRIALQFTSRKKKAGSGLKADQWKRVVQMLPVALYASWRSEDSDAICPTEIEEDEEVVEPAPVPEPTGRRKRIKQPVKTPSTDRVRWYSAILSFCAGIRILHAHSITQNDADDGVQYLADAACSILSLDGHLTPNWHIAMHYSHFVMLYGPLQGYGTWPFERNNGKLSRIKHNLKPHETPSTVLRAWLLESHIAKVLSNPAPDADPRELAALERMREDRQKTRGTVMLDEVRGNKANRTMRLPAPYRPKQMVSLRRLSAYEPLLRYLTINYPQCNLVDVAHLQGENPCLPDRSHECYTLYTHVVFNGFKFCSLLYSRGRKDQFALATIGTDPGRELCRLHLILQVDLPLPHGRLRCDLVLVERFMPATSEAYPWSPFAIDLGIRIYKNIRREMCFIPLEALAAPTIVTRLSTHTDGDCLISLSCDTDGQEPEFWLEDDDDVQPLQDLDDEGDD